MNSIPQAVKSQANPAGKIALSVGSAGGAAFTVKQLPGKVGTITGTGSNTISTPGASTGGLPAAFIKINHAATSAGMNQNTPTTHLNTAAKIQIQPGVASSVQGGGPLFSMTLNPPLLNSTAATTAGVKRKAEQMENHTN